MPGEAPAYDLKAASGAVAGVAGREEDSKHVADLFANDQFKAIIEVYEQLQRHQQTGLEPVTKDAQGDVAKCLSVLEGMDSAEAKELKALLQSTEIQQVVAAHDKVAQKDFEEEKAAVTTVQSAKAAYFMPKQVQIDRGSNPLGITIIQSGEMIVVQRVVAGSPAARSGLINVGDQLLKVFSKDTAGKKCEDVVEWMKNSPSKVTLKIKPAANPKPVESNTDAKLHVRALFSHDAATDSVLPCKELGVTFKRGQILHVLSKDDPNWWQVKVDGSEKVGIAPSRTLEEKLQKAIASTAAATTNGSVAAAAADDTPKKDKRKSSIFSKKNKRGTMYKATQSAGKKAADAVKAETFTYEEVVHVPADSNRYKVLLLVGPAGVGRNSLKRRLLSEFPSKYATTVPHTSRAPREKEVDGTNYNFVSRDTFVKEMAAGNFVEHGEYSDNFYGTHMSSIKKATDKGKICILDCHPQAAKALLAAKQLLPYVAFITPPSGDALEKSRSSATPEQVKTMLTNAEKMDAAYGHLFNCTVLNEKLDAAYADLKEALNKAETEPQWIPTTFA